MSEAADNAPDPKAPPPDSMNLTVREALATMRISRSTFYELVRSNELQIMKIRGRTLVRRIDLEALQERSLVRHAA